MLQVRRKDFLESEPIDCVIRYYPKANIDNTAICDTLLGQNGLFQMQFVMLCYVMLSLCYVNVIFFFRFSQNFVF